jgi:hypothetical protein
MAFSVRPYFFVAQGLKAKDMLDIGLGEAWEGGSRTDMHMYEIRSLSCYVIVDDMVALLGSSRPLSLFLY